MPTLSEMVRRLTDVVESGGDPEFHLNRIGEELQRLESQASSERRVVEREFAQRIYELVVGFEERTHYKVHRLLWRKEAREPQEGGGFRVGLVLNPRERRVLGKGSGSLHFYRRIVDGTTGICSYYKT